MRDLLWRDLKGKVQSNRSFLLEGVVCIQKALLLCRRAHTHTHTPSFSFISLLASFLPSSPPAAQVPVLFAVAGNRSSVLQSGSPAFLRTSVLWKNSQGLKPLLISHSSLFFPSLCVSCSSICVRLHKISHYSRCKPSNRLLPQLLHYHLSSILHFYVAFINYITSIYYGTLTP